ncbi:MAG: hypothetical protein ACI3VE_02530 [Oscillospiraceae bacterium]
MDSQYEIKYNNLMQGLEEMHEKNVKRTRAALRCLLIIPAVILLMLFMTKGSKTIFLVLWIASMFIIAFVLIVVEYQDYLLRKMVAKSQETIQTIPEAAAAGVATAAGSSHAGQRADAIRQSIQQRSPDHDGKEDTDFKYDNYDESAGES